MRTLLFVLAIIFIAISCTTAADKTIKSENKFDTLPLPLDSSTFYIKTKAKWQDSTQNALDTFVNGWYSKMLFAMREPVLSNHQGDKEIYRFTWLRTFHHPVSVRLEKQNNTTKLFGKVCNGASGYEPGQLIFDTIIDITPAEHNLLTQKIDEIDFWRLPTEKINDMGDDGSEWVIEAVKGDQYHIVTRWSPTEERQGNFRSVGEYLVSLSRISKEEKKYFY